MTRAARKTTRKTPSRRQQPQRLLALCLFLLALAMRWLFWQATPDAEWPYSVYYKGDAMTWLAYADALQQDRVFELGLPLRPPATGYLIAAVWNGRPDGIATLRLLWCVLGALTVPLIYSAARRSFGEISAIITGLICATSTGLMVLSTSLNNETPYLLLVAATFYLWQPLRQQPTGPRLALWGLLNALACLTRVEHALYFVAATTALVMLWHERGAALKVPLRRLAVAATGCTLVLAPWHLHAWGEIRRFNLEPAAVDPATEAAWDRVEAALAVLAWDDEAIAEKQALPAFIRRTASNSVAATVLTRGRREVTAGDFETLDEAFGYRPRAVAGFPFVALYGGLNFYLANNQRVEDGFDRSVLEEPPPLAGGADRYPRALLAGLPPPDLALTYPPHLEIVNRGYRLGALWIVENPGSFFTLMGHKLDVFWRGASLGLGGNNLPLGLSGIRRPVDLAVPEGGSAGTVWGLGLLAISLWGAWLGTRQRDSTLALLPWLLFLTSKVIVVIAFFGYARHGASVIPVVALLLALAGASLPARLRDQAPGRKRWAQLAVATALTLLAIESARWIRQPEVLLDDRQAGVRDPWPVDRHVRRQVTIEPMY